MEILLATDGRRCARKVVIEEDDVCELAMDTTYIAMREMQ
jgi:hypothetical protein